MNTLSLEQLNWLTDQTNRSNVQTLELYRLCDQDFEKLKQLEVQIKNCFVHFCPGDKEAMEYVLNLTPKSDYFKLTEI